MAMARALIIVPLLMAMTPKPTPVPFCTLQGDAARYAGARVETHATYVHVAQEAFLFDPSCNGDDAYVELDLSACEGPACRSLEEQLASAHEAEMRARWDLALTGRLREWNGAGFGAAGRRLLLEVEGVDSITEAAVDAGWPDTIPRRPAPFLERVRLLRAQDRALCEALARGDKTAVASMTTPDYVFATTVALPAERRRFLASLEPLCPGGLLACEQDQVSFREGLAVAVGSMFCSDQTFHMYSQSYTETRGRLKAIQGSLHQDYVLLAQRLLGQLTATYDHDHEWREVALEDLPEPYRSRQQGLKSKLQALGFEHLGWIEDLTLTRIYPQSSAVMGIFVLDDGLIKAETSVIADHSLVSLVTALANGSVIATSNADIAGALESPATYDQLPLPFSTEPREVLEVHRQRLVEPLRTSAPVKDATLLAVVDAMTRRFAVVREHRRAVGYMTRREAERFNLREDLKGEPLDIFYAAFAHLVEQHRRAAR
jgi:hypothetical protein